ncbi:MAG TPA: NPCBM/NEW2 domain-containing protein [Tepidisphaeraceae bacterium]
MQSRSKSRRSRCLSVLVSAISSAVESLERRQMFAAHIGSTDYATIQQAVDSASVGATITVDPGTYNEQVVVGKSVIIKGAMAGVDARSNARSAGAGESVIQGIIAPDGTRTYSFKIVANDVTLDGFTVQGQNSQSNSTAAGIVINPNIAGTKILNNVVKNNVTGMYLANNSSTKAALIQHNVFLANNNAGPNVGRAIYTDGGVSGGLLQNVIIDGNFFNQNLGTPDFEAQPAIGLESYTTASQKNIQITNNVFEKNGKAVLSINVNGMTFSGNLVGNHYDTPSAALRFEGGDSNITVTNNSFYASGARAIRIDQKAVSQDNFNIVIQNNNIYKNGLEYDAAFTGLMTNTLQYQGSLTATNNYWGASNGPSGLGSGSGDAILNNGITIVYQPYATSYVINPQVAWNGLPSSVTGKIEAENFDHGLEGVSYHDVSSGNSAGQYRPNQDADISSTTDSGGGYHLSSVRAGEWTEYTVNVGSGGTYTGQFRVANSGSGGVFHVEVDGTNVTGAVSVPNTGGTSTWQTLSKTGINLPSGQHIIRIVYDTAASSGIVANFNWFQFNLTSGSTTPSAPSNVVATASSSTSVALTWQDNSTSESGFILERMTGTTNVWNSITTTAANVTSYTDNTVVAGTTYTYRVRATSSSGSSANATSNAVTTPSGSSNVTYLSDLTWASATNGWGPVEKDMANGGQAAGDGKVTTINGVTYSKGLGVHADSEIVYNLGGQYSNFLSDVGVDDETGAAAGLVFRVYADNVKVYDSGGMSQVDAAKTISLSVAGVQQLRLVVNDIDGDYSYDHGDWAGARLTKSTSTAPAAPTGLTATAASSTQINLSWNDVTGETGYKVLRSTDNTNFAQIGATLAANTTTYSDTTVSGSTVYYYKVVATSTGGDSAPSSVASASPLQPPAAPTNLTATPFSATQINLSWTDVTGETGYKVMRSSDNVNFSQVGATLAANATAYSDTSVSGSTVYYYKVIATSTNGDSQPSNVASSTPLVPPAAPTNVTVTPVSGTQINLSWNDVAGETGFKVLRSTDNVNFSQIGSTLAQNVTTYSDTAVSGTTTYYYQVVATNAAGDSQPSATVSSQPLQPPAAPGNLAATPVSGTQINLSWSDVAGESGFKVLRSTDNVNFAQIGATLAANTLTYSDTTVSGATTYYYQVVAVNSVGDSQPSTTVSAQPVQPPAAPSSLAANAMTSSQVNLSWQDVVGETGYKIERSTDNINFTQIGTAAVNATTYSDTTVSGGIQYYYRIRATNSGGDSAYSNTASASTPVTPTAPAAPSNLTATAASPTQINLSWKDNSGNETGFKIERSLKANTGWSLIGTVSANVTTYSDTNSLNPGTTYYYRVRATNVVGDSANSNTASAATPTAPAPTTQTLISTGSVWKYLDNGSDQGTGWRATSFDDSTWKSGAAQLGYGDGDEATVVSYGSNSNLKYVTTYFRKSFAITDPTKVTALALRLMRDDGAVVYLNGTEVYRNNMPTGTIGYMTFASTAVEESTYYSANISPSLLVAGANVITVEIHQSDRTSSDISFDLELKATLAAGATTAATTQPVTMQEALSTSTLSTDTTDKQTVLA